MKSDYYLQENFCSLADIQKINSMLDEDSKFSNIEDRPAGSGIIKTADTKTVYWGDARRYLSKLEESIHHANSKYFGFELYNMTGFECVNYNIYSEDKHGEYGWHSDGDNENIFDLKLTTILNLSSEPYEGGVLELFLGGEMPIKQFNAPGSFIIFPSFIQHRVTPVTRGTRKTVSLWTKGPLFR